MNLTEQLILLDKFGIDSNELLLVTIILLTKDGEEADAVKYFNLDNKCRGNVLAMLHSLQDKEIIVKSCVLPQPGERFIPQKINFNTNFVRQFWKASSKMGEELLDAYPDSTIVNDVEYKLKRVSKKYDSLEDAWRVYGRAISWNPEIHQEVLELIEWGKNTGYSFTNLGDFIVDRDWQNLKRFKEKGTVYTKIDNIKAV